MFESESEVAQSCLTLCDPVDCSYLAPPSRGDMQIPGRGKNKRLGTGK